LIFHRHIFRLEASYVGLFKFSNTLMFSRCSSHIDIMIDDNKENVRPTLHNFKLTTSIQSLPKYETNNIYAMFE